MLDLSLEMKNKFLFFPFSISHFPFPIFPLVRQKLYYPQTSPSKDQRMSNIWQLPSIKPTPANKDDHHNRHLSSNIYQIYLLAQTNPITSITSLCLTILPFLFAAPTHYPATCYLPFNTYYLLLFLPIPTAPAYYLTTSYSLFTTCSCS